MWLFLNTAFHYFGLLLFLLFVCFFVFCFVLSIGNGGVETRLVVDVREHLERDARMTKHHKVV